MLQSFRPKLECRNRGKPLSCALSRLFSLAYSQGRVGRGTAVRSGTPRDMELTKNCNINNIHNIHGRLTMPLAQWPTLSSAYNSTLVNTSDSLTKSR